MDLVNGVPSNSSNDHNVLPTTKESNTRLLTRPAQLYTRSSQYMHGTQDDSYSEFELIKHAKELARLQERRTFEAKDTAEVWFCFSKDTEETFEQQIMAPLVVLIFAGYISLGDWILPAIFLAVLLNHVPTDLETCSC
ncbi:hypothetical protein Tco_0576418 [Tanacetum coccineum]